MMGSFSIWHWLIVLVIIGVPLFFILKSRPEGPNRFGSVPQAQNFGGALSAFFQNYVNFSGRASRSEFWYSMLFVSLISLVLDLVDQSSLLSGVWTLAILLPSIAVTARRLHDTNRSGWLQLLAMLPPIGTITLIVWYCMAASDKIVAAEEVAITPAKMVDLDVLERLAKLKASGVITAEEYELEKKKILGG